MKNKSVVVWLSKTSGSLLLAKIELFGILTRVSTYFLLSATFEHLSVCLIDYGTVIWAYHIGA